ncbi:unnamed protein product [Rotaria sordida]|uniref:Uncharacterized protein n=1 Tax=Rotaria sordida TaxID=392033 RepID=A0A813MUS9_9BILA|nr:unnamed protein product [Rotaria sordida]CAF0729694.1 unnamed protein product [Rotaria sordida]CAF0743981.1 unnamed protein product [Rotaria sordida]CAF0758157.1 unnamed protein product [Rotaria sordida]CAF0796487.1 unnamed protein product [Rotaria sordida]
MPCRSQKVLCNKKKSNSSNTGTDQLIPLNMNACNQTQSNIISHLESIGNLIINELTGSERNRLKQQLLISCISNTNPIHNLPFSSSKTNLKQVLTDLHTYDCHTQRQYRTIGIGDNDINISTSKTNVNQLDITTTQNNNTNILNNEIQLSTITKRKKRQINHLNLLQINEPKNNTSNIITRTICTRSSKLNSLNNNQEQSNSVILHRTRKRRLSLINPSTPSNNNVVDNTIEESHLDLQKNIGNDVSGIKVSRKKLQSSVPLLTSIEYSKTINDF